MGKRDKGNSIVDFPNSYCVVDIETTGLDFDYCGIIEISALKVINGEKTDVFSSLINPGYKIDEFITDLTGITNDMLSSAPSIESVLPKFIEFVGDLVLVGHNIASFDSNFIYDNIKKSLHKDFKNDYVDTMRISRLILKDISHYRLSDIADFYKIDKKGAHRAENDCHITFEVFKALKSSCIENYGSVDDFKNILAQKRANKKYLRASDILCEVSNDDIDITNPFYEKVCVFTGTLERMPRREAMQIVKNLGGEVGDGVTKKTNYLILGNNDFCKTIKDGKSSKQKKAEKLILEGNDLEIISENVFYSLIEED